jgi:hypothetical protein
MSLKLRTFRAPKEAEDIVNCQDSVYPLPGQMSTDVFAISDGTGTSFLPRDWANILTRRFGEFPDQAFVDWSAWLKRAQEQWYTTIAQRAKANDANFLTKNDFYARKPAAATLVGLTIGPAENKGLRWRALVAGDSCLLFLRDDGQPTSFEIQKSVDFSSVVPNAIESYARNEDLAPAVYESLPQGTQPLLASGDAILLATDALSKWLLLRHEQEQPVWGTVLSLQAPADFEALINNARRDSENRLENDDVALAIIMIGAPHPIYSQQTFVPKIAGEPQHVEYERVNTPPPLRGKRSIQNPLPVQDPRTDFPRSVPELWTSDLTSRGRSAATTSDSNSWFLRRHTVVMVVSLAAVVWLGFLYTKNCRAYVAEKKKTQQLRMQLEAANSRLSQTLTERTELQNRLAQDERDMTKSQTQLHGELDDLRHKLTESENARESLSKENETLRQKVPAKVGLPRTEAATSPPAPSVEPSIAKPPAEEQVQKPREDRPTPKRLRANPHEPPLTDAGVRRLFLADAE